MLRRGFLQGAIGTAGLVSEGCVREAAPPAVPSLTATDREVLARMDRTLSGIRATPDQPWLVTSTLASMHTVATFADLDKAAQAHPDVQRRMWAALPEIHASTMAMADRLDSIGPEERRRIDARIRSDADLPMRIVERVDDEAKRHGIPEAHCLRMRSIAAHVAWRLKTQGTSALLDDLVGRVDRVIARHGEETELSRAVAAKVAEAQLFGFPTEGQVEEPAPQPGQGPEKIRVRFNTFAPPAEVQRAACTLQARFAIEGKERALDLAGCGPRSEGGLEGAVHVTANERSHDVVLEVVVPPDLSPAGRDELRQAVRDAGAELRRRAIAATPQQQVVLAPSSTLPPTTEPAPSGKMRTSQKILIVSLILWGLGIGTAIGGGALVAGSRGSDGGWVAGAFLLTAASLLGVGGLVTIIVSAALYANDK